MKSVARVLQLATAIAVPLVCGAQNLVPNGSFEDTTACPDYFGQWWRAAGWENASFNSPDYLNACAGGVVCGVPFNHLGYQLPAHGDAYMGLITYSFNDFDYREIVTAELAQPLQVGVPVFLSFKTSCGGYGSVYWGSANWKARGPGLKFFVNPPADWSSYLYPNSAAVYMDTVLSDTSATWVTVSGMYVPDSAYRYLAIGNFFEDSLSWPSIQDTVYGTLGGAYAFVDEVCVSQNPQYCSSDMAVIDCSAGLYNLIYETHTGDVVLWAGVPPGLGTQVGLFDAAGRMLRLMPWQSGQRELRMGTESLSSGLYTMVVLGAAKAIQFVHISP